MATLKGQERFRMDVKTTHCFDNYDQFRAADTGGQIGESSYVEICSARAVVSRKNRNEMITVITSRPTIDVFTANVCNQPRLYHKLMAIEEARAGLGQQSGNCWVRMGYISHYEKMLLDVADEVFTLDQLLEVLQE